MVTPYIVYKTYTTVSKEFFNSSFYMHGGIT